MVVDFDNAFKSGTRDSEMGEQSRGNNHKYNRSAGMPVLMAKPYSEFRPLPDVDPQTGQIRPFVNNGHLTWTKFMFSADYVGLVFVNPNKPQWTIRNTLDFWLVPRDLLDYFGDIRNMSGDAMVEEVIRSSPYSQLYYRISESDGDPDAPREWVALSDAERWCQLIGADRQQHKVYSPPLQRPEEHLLMRAQMLSNGGGKKSTGDWENQTYEDSRSPGSLHPCVVELGKSATKSAKRAIYEQQGNQGFRLTGDIADPQQGQVLRLKKDRVVRDDGSGGYNVHSLSLKGQTKAVDPQEILNEWHPWKKSAVVGGDAREPILQIQTVEEQVSMLISVFGPEVVDYAFQSTPYEAALPDGAKGSYEQWQKTRGNQSWLQLAHGRVVQRSQAIRAAKAQQNQVQQGQGQQSRPLMNQFGGSGASQGAQTAQPAQTQPAPEKQSQLPFDQSQAQPQDQGQAQEQSQGRLAQPQDQPDQVQTQDQPVDNGNASEDQQSGGMPSKETIQNMISNAAGDTGTPGGIDGSVADAVYGELKGMDTPETPPSSGQEDNSQEEEGNQQAPPQQGQGGGDDIDKPY